MGLGSFFSGLKRALIPRELDKLNKAVMPGEVRKWTTDVVDDWVEEAPTSPYQMGNVLRKPIDQTFGKGAVTFGNREVMPWVGTALGWYFSGGNPLGAAAGGAAGSALGNYLEGVHHEEGGTERIAGTAAQRGAWGYAAGSAANSMGAQQYSSGGASDLFAGGGSAASSATHGYGGYGGHSTGAPAQTGGASGTGVYGGQSSGLDAGWVLTPEGYKPAYGMNSQSPAMAGIQGSNSPALSQGTKQSTKGGGMFGNNKMTNLYLASLLAGGLSDTYARKKGQEDEERAKKEYLADLEKTREAASWTPEKRDAFMKGIMGQLSERQAGQQTRAASDLAASGRGGGAYGRAGERTDRENREMAARMLAETYQPTNLPAADPNAFLLGGDWKGKAANDWGSLFGSSAGNLMLLELMRNNYAA